MIATTPCPKKDELEHFSLGQVREGEAESLEAHLASCPLCVETLHGIKNADTLVEAMRAQSTLLARPRVDETVSQLMAALKGMTPSVACENSVKTTSKGNSACQEMIDFLAPSQAPDEIGRLGSYRIIKILGAGGMGVVFAAEDSQLRRTVALKALRPLLAANSVARKRFLREARAAAKLSHDHVVAIYQVGEDRGVPFLAMQYLEGETLEARLQREGPLAVADILHIGRQLATGLAAAHHQGLLHRDIKPANIWLESKPGDRPEELRVKLLDFGLAWVADADGPLTECGTVVGTPPYMAPEQARGEPADVRSDLFSLGSVLYSMCTGKSPFQGNSTFATLEMVRTQTPRPIQEINSVIPQWLVEVATKLHAKNPADRFQTAAEVAAVLQEPARPVACQASRPSLAGRWWTAAAALFLLPLLGLTLYEVMALTHFREMVTALDENRDEPKTVLPLPTKPPITNDEPAQKQVADPPREPAPKSTVYPAALFTFEERGPGVRDTGAKVTDILFAKLAARPDVYLVDRADLKKLLAELELNLSGVVKASEAAKVGQMTGAKMLVTGSVIQIDKKTYLVAKIIGTETSRVFGVSVDGKSSDELAPLVEKLAEAVAEKIAREGDKLVARVSPRPDRIADLNKKIKGTRPTVMIKITERHIGAVRIDPAVETEIAKFCKETGFTVLAEDSKVKADVVIVGEAFSETATRNGNLISVKARVEIKAIDRQSAHVLAIDRQTALVVDLAENIAAKAALEEAAALLAERILPKLVK